MEEYDIALDTQESSILLQYPLNTEMPVLQEIKTKNQDKFAEAVGRTGAGENSYSGTGASTINKYYILSIDREIVGRSVKSIFQMRPFLPETEDTVKKTEKKETKIFAMNETQEELENRMKNPNYVAEKFKKMPWKAYIVSEEREEIPYLLHKKEPSTDLFTKQTVKCARHKEPSIHIEQIRETIYNARVVNMEELCRIYPTASISDVNQAISEMTVKVLNRYVLKPEYFNDLAPVLMGILTRMKNAQGILKLTKEEIANSSEEFNYVLGQISHKENHYYKLKGYFE